MPSQFIKTFIAIELEEKTKDKVFEIQSSIKQTNCIKGSWVSKGNLHLTLKFLGDTELKQINNIKEKIAECCKNKNSIPYNINAVGLFPNDRFARVLWVGIEKGSGQIKGLAKKLEDGLSKIGFKKEKREFKTHITICRIKQILDHNKFKSLLEETNNLFKPTESVISKITFFESKLSPQGSIYTALFTQNLK